MTEEREKQLARIWQDKWMEETSGTLHVGTMFIHSLIHGIAAEARKEGIEEALASFNLIAPGKDVPVDMIRQAITERFEEQG